MNLTTGEMCKECGCRVFSFIDRLGEKTCDDCGLVVIVNPFEESTIVVSLFDEDKRSATAAHGSLGSFISRQDSYGSKDTFALYREQIRSQPQTPTDRRARLLINTTLSFYSSSFDIKNRTHGYYKTMSRERVFRGSDIERRCAGLTYFVLKELGIVCNLRNHAKYTKVTASEISKMAKRIARFQRKAHVFTNDNHIAKSYVLLDKIDSANEVNITSHYRECVLRMVEYISRHIEALDMRYSDTMLVATFWLTAQMTNSKDITQTMICDEWNSSVVGLRLAITKFYNIFKFDRKRLSDMDVEDFVSGVRY